MVVIAGVGTVYATRNHGENSSDDPSYKLGKMIQQQDQEGDTSDELYAVGKDIQITKQEMENHEKRFALGDEEEQDPVTDDGKSSEEKAFQALVRRKTLALQQKRQAVRSVIRSWMRLSAKTENHGRGYRRSGK